MMNGKPARNMYSTDNNKEYRTRRILLVVFKKTLKMQGPMDVKLHFVNHVLIIYIKNQLDATWQYVY